MIRPSRPAQPAASRPSGGRGGADVLVVIVALVIAAVIAVPGSMAAWTKTEETSAVVVTTGSAVLSLVELSGGVPQLSPGRTSVGPVYSLENTGDVPLELSGAVIATGGVLGSQTTVTLSSGGDQSCQSATVSVLPGAPHVPFGRLDPGEATYMCTAFALATTTPDIAQYEPAPAFTITVTGAQVR